MKIILIILTIFLSGCKLNKVVNHHGIHNLETKSKELFINKTNINQIRSLLGPPSSTSYFDDDILMYLEKKTSNTKLLKLGKKKLIANNILLLEIDGKGMLINKEFLNQDDLNKLVFSKKVTKTFVDQESFLHRALSGVITKIDDPLGKKRGTLGK